MAIKYDDSILKEINDNVDIIALIEDYGIPLERKGRDYFGHCPFHVDKTPSFSVTPGKNSYFCFSCGKGGKAIGFLMEYRDFSIDEAVEIASDYAGVDVSKMCRSKTLAFLRNYQNEKETRKPKEVFHRILPKSEITKYKKTKISLWLDEGISQEMLDLFDVRFDEEKNRIVYPVNDINGRLINIKGRTTFENYKAMNIPKYTNYYKVGVMDYFQGLDKTLQYVKEKHEIIIFESLKSVMKAGDYGYMNSASAEKHTLTPEQIRLLISLGCDVVLAYDSDVDYDSEEIRKDIDKLKSFVNLFIIRNVDELLGDKEAKNAPVDKGSDIWETLYRAKEKVT